MRRENPYLDKCFIGVLKRTIALQVMERQPNAKLLQTIISLVFINTHIHSKKKDTVNQRSFSKAQSIHQRQKCAMGRGRTSHLGHGVQAAFTAHWTLMLLPCQRSITRHTQSHARECVHARTHMLSAQLSSLSPLHSETEAKD